MKEVVKDRKSFQKMIEVILEYIETKLKSDPFGEQEYQELEANLLNIYDVVIEYEDEIMNLTSKVEIRDKLKNQIKEIKNDYKNFKKHISNRSERISKDEKDEL